MGLWANGQERDVVFVAILLAALLTFVFVWSLRDAMRNPPVYDRLYNEAPWRRVQVWVWGITLAALAGAWLEGGNETVLSVIALAGFVVGWVCSRFIANAAMKRRLRDFFGD